MSLGFLTESTILPSKSTPIQVDSKSVLDLKAIVYEKEQLREKNASNSSASRYKRGRHQQKTEKQEKSNKGLKERMQRDEDLYLDDSERAKKKRSFEILQKKAELYDQLSRGEVSQIDPNILVNFKEKLTTTAPVAPPADLVEIKDEFGRTRFVSRASVHESTTTISASTNTPAAATSGPRDGHVASQWEKTLKSSEKEYLQQMSVETQRARENTAAKKQKKAERLKKLRVQQETNEFLTSIKNSN